MYGILSRAATIGLTCLISVASANAGQHYHVTNLGPQGVKFIQYADSGAINSGGLVTQTYGSQPEAGLFNNGAVTNLGTLGGLQSYAYAINDVGNVVGSSQTSDGSWHAFIYQNGVLADLGVPSGLNSSEALGIDVHGNVVIDASGAHGSKVFLLSGGRFKHIAAPTGALTSYAYGMSRSGGYTTGYLTEVDQSIHAFVAVNGAMQDIGALPGGTFTDSRGVAINSKGQMAGYSTGNGFSIHATMYSNGTLKDLGVIEGTSLTSPSQASAINDHGSVVGISVDATGAQTAFLYNGKVMVDLNTLLDSASGNVHLDAAYGINDAGQISGLATIDGVPSVFLATPVK